MYGGIQYGLMYARHLVDTDSYEECVSPPIYDCNSAQCLCTELACEYLAQASSI
jgi:hypothetical protein